MSGKTILILGGGIGGLIAANELRRLMPAEHRVVMVERNPQHAFAPSFLWIMVGDRKPGQATRPVQAMVRPGVEVVIADIQSIDVANRRVQTSKQALTYDYLIVALGAELAPDAIPGLAQAAHTFYTLEGSVKLHEALKSFKGGKVAVLVSAMPYKCPGAPHEGAMLISDFFRRQGLRDKVEVHLFTPEPQPMPVAGPALGDAVKQMLGQQDVKFHPLHKFAGVDPQARALAFEGKDPFQYDLLVAIPPHRGSRIAREAGLTNDAGWIPVDRNTLKTKHENVYAIGDATALSLPGKWKPEVPLALPKAGVFAHVQAETVAHRIAAEVTGSANSREFPGVGYCMLEAGESLAGFAYGNFFAEPSPQIEMRKLGSMWHVGKVVFEQWWLAPYGPKRAALNVALTVGSKVLGIPTMI